MHKYSICVYCSHMQENHQIILSQRIILTISIEIHIVTCSHFSTNKKMMQKANSAILCNNIVTSYHLLCICYWKWHRLVKEDHQNNDALRRSCSTRYHWESSGILLHRKKLHCLRLGRFQKCVHCTVFRKSVMWYKIPVYMYITNLKWMLLILSSVACRKCPLHLFKTEVQNY